MSNFHDFLVWFDGWSENIEKTPNEKQWTRLKAKIAEVRAVEPVPVTVPPAVLAQFPPAPAPEPPKQPSSEKEWRAFFIAALMQECGMDHESANDVWGDYKRDREDNIDITLSPRTEAVQASGGMN